MSDNEAELSLTPMSKKAVLFPHLVLALLIVAISFQLTFAADKPITIYLFWTEGCPHCAHEKEFLARLAREDPHLKIVTLEVSRRQENRELFQKIGKFLNADVSGVPFTVIGTEYLIGWQDDSTTGRTIETLIKNAQRQNSPDIVARLQISPAPSLPPAPPVRPVPETMMVPWFGQIDLKYLSLGLVTVIIGALDGFNPCAMWVLIFLINLLLGMEDHKRMWILGGAFIIASSAVYFLFMTAWLNILIFLGFIFWIRIAIGLIAFFAGGYNLREYLRDNAGVCTLSHGARRQHTMDRLKEIIAIRTFWLALGGIMVLAFMVNLVELICSAGFPVIYLQILSLTPLPFWQYYLYLLLYIFIFMLDDIIVFVAAMLTLQLVGATTRYKRYSSLIGGVFMVILGVLLIFKPGWLMFG